MSDLSPDLQRLVVAGRLASQPNDADRARVFAALDARLGIAAGIAAGALGASVTQSSASAVSAKTVGIAAATLAILAGGLLLVHSLTGSRAPEVVSTGNTAATGATRRTSATAEPTPPLTPSPAPPATTAVPLEPNTAPAPGSARASGRARDSLPAEVAILSRAQTELHGGRAENALRLLAEHERKFKRGILAEERTSAKIQALCALGRVSEASALIGRLSPQSLTGDSARQACSSSKKVIPVR